MKLTNLIALYEDESGKRVAVLYGSGKVLEKFSSVAKELTGNEVTPSFTGKTPIRVIKQLAFNEFWLKQEAELERILNGGGEPEKA